MNNPFDHKTQASHPGSDSELAVKSELHDDLLKAHTRHEIARAADQEKLTELKGRYAGAVLRFLWVWFTAMVLATITYFSSSLMLGSEIPKEVIMAMFGSTTVVVGLVGYVLKGLFGGNGK